MEKKNNPSFKITCLIILTTAISLLAHSALAETKTFVKENEQLKRELMTAKGEKKQETAQAYQRNIENLTADEWLEKGYALGTSGNHTGAIEAFTKAIELNPQDADTYYNRGLSYDSLGNYQEAIQDYDKAIELDPQYADAYVNRGAAYDSLGNYQQAIKDYDKVIELNPQYALAYYNRGRAYDKLGNYQQAIKDYDKAIELNPKNVSAYYNKACVYSLTNDPLEACKWLKISIEKGYNKWDYIKSDSDLNNIRNSSCYRQIMSGK